MHTPLNVAVIGCGHWGRNYVRLISELPDSRVAVVCDQSEARLNDIKSRFVDIPTTTNVADVLTYDIDAAVICTTASTHYTIARPFLEAGIPLLVEKPLTINAAEAEILTELAEARDTILMVGHIFLFNPGVQKVKEYIKKSETGSIYYMHSRRTNLGPVRHDVNALWDLATHDISIFNYLLDSEPEWVSAVGGKVLRNNRDDVGFATLGYGSGVLGHIHVSWADPTKVREVVVVGSRVRIAFNDLDASEKVRVYYKGMSSENNEASNYGEFQSEIHDGDVLSPRVEMGEPLKNQMMHFIECVQKHQQPISDGHAGLSIVRSLEAIDRSIENNGAPVQVMTQGLVHAQ